MSTSHEPGHPPATGPATEPETGQEAQSTLSRQIRANEEITARSARLLRIATTASVAAASVLIAAKATAWALTGSVSVLSTLIDSLMDAGASLVNLIAVRNALKPADADHRFGHGKAEPLAAMAQAAFVAGSSLFLVIEASDRFFNPVPIVRHEVGIAVMVFAIIVTFALVAYQTYVVRRTRSLAIGADSLHYKGDVLIHGSVIVSLLASAYFGISYLDPLFGIGIAAYLLWNAWSIAAGAFDELMDREFDEADRLRILAIAQKHPQVRDVHDLRTRSSGPRSFIQFHLELDRGISLVRAHEISDEVEAEVRAAFPGAGVIIHQDPEGIMEHRAAFNS